MHRGLWVPGGRAEPFFPLGARRCCQTTSSAAPAELPLHVLAREITPGEELQTGGHNQTVTAVYNGEVDFGTVFYSVPLKPDGTPLAETAAPDGEEYFVMSFYFAAARWGNGSGIYNYKEWADKILTTMRHHKLKSGATKFGPRTVGPMVNEAHKMICFVPDKGGNEFTDPSYHLPAFYELWSRWGPQADRSFWAAAADTSRNFFQRATNAKTGLAPDYANFNGTPKITDWNQFSHHFSYDAWRTASNWSVDWAWWQKDVREQELSNRIQSFFASLGMDLYGSQFTLDGRTLNETHAIGLVSTNAVACLANYNRIARGFVEGLWKSPVPQTFDTRYYDGLLYMMSLLHCGAEFKIWKLQ